MKKIMLCACMALVALTCVAQTSNKKIFVFKNGTITHRLPITEVDKIKVTQYYEAVDLGLTSGLKWAAYNVGATVPEEYGDYFAWGEIVPKDVYTPATSLTYNVNLTVDEVKGSLQYDAATANWGGTWRMPTHTELNELISECKWAWATINGVSGYKATGPNGNSIFFPAAGVKMYSSAVDAGTVGEYWIATPHEASSQISENKMAHFLFFYKTKASKTGYYRTFLYRSEGKPIRPVCK